jgi:hypothetical protein
MLLIQPRHVGQHNAQRNTNNIIKTSALLQTIGVKTNRTSFLCGKIQWDDSFKILNSLVIRRRCSCKTSDTNCKLECSVYSGAVGMILSRCGKVIMTNLKSSLLSWSVVKKKIISIKCHEMRQMKTFLLFLFLSQVLWGLLFLTFETDQFLFLAMWDFLILH